MDFSQGKQYLIGISRDKEGKSVSEFTQITKRKAREAHRGARENGELGWRTEAACRGLGPVPTGSAMRWCVHQRRKGLAVKIQAKVSGKLCVLSYLKRTDFLHLMN